MLKLYLSEWSCHAATGVRESWCSRAWRRQGYSRFWLRWTFVFGRKHCLEEWEHYWRVPG